MNFLIEFDYDADQSDELSLKKGDIVKNVKFYEEGWMSGDLNGKHGVFPDNFGKEIKSENEIKGDEGTDINQTEEKVKPTKKVMGVGFGNIFEGKKIQLKRHSDNKIPSLENEVKVEPSLDKPSDAGNVSKVDLVKVTVSYATTNSNELVLEEGDIVTVLERKGLEEGLWRGKLNGKIGLFPSNFVMPYGNEEVTKPALPVPVNKGAPPPLLTAKPKTKLAPPRPQSNIVQLAKPSPKADDVEPIEIGFDTPITHKPLISPTAERARRPNVRLPKKESPLSDKDGSKVSERKSTDTDLIDKTSEKTTTSALKVDEEKTVKNTIPELNLPTSDVNTKSSSDNKRTVTAVPGKSKEAEGGDVTTVAHPVLRASSINAEEPAWKKNLRPKSQFVNSTAVRDNERSKVDNVSDVKDMNKRIEGFESKISDLEREIGTLREHMADLAKTNSDQIINLTDIVNDVFAKLLVETDRREAMERELSQMKDGVVSSK